MIVVLAFVVGLFFMLLYYRLFHTSKISSAFQRSSDPTENGSSGTNGQNRNGKSQNISEKVCEAKPYALRILQSEFLLQSLTKS